MYNNLNRSLDLKVSLKTAVNYPMIEKAACKEQGNFFQCLMSAEFVINIICYSGFVGVKFVHTNPNY
jgi:hypothetical protein